MPWRRLVGSSWAPIVATLVGLALIVVSQDVAILDLLKFSGYLGLAVALPGVFTWRLLLRHLHTGEADPPTWFEDLTLGTIFGFGVQLPFYLFGVWIGLPLLFLVVPAAVLAVSATPVGRRVWTLPTRRLDVRASWALAVTIVYAAAWLAFYLFPKRPLSLLPSQTPSVDETFHQALISELLHHVPPQIPFLLDTPLAYHWFVHAQMATDHWVTQLDTAVLLRILMPVAMLTLTILGLGAAALRLSRRPVAAVIAPALLIAGAFSLMGPHYVDATFSEPFLSRRFISSPSQSYGFMMALPAIMLIFEVLRPDHRASRLTWITLALTLLALSGSKATFMPIFLCGALAAWAVHYALTRTVSRTMAGVVGLLLVVTAFAQVVLLRGSTGAMAFAPFRTAEQAVKSQHFEITTLSTVAMTTTLLIGWLLYGAGAFGLHVGGRWHDLRALWMLLSIPVGIAVALLFFRSGLSQLWFQRSVAELVVLVSAWGVVQLLPNPLTTRHAVRLGGVAVVAGLVAFTISSALEAGRPKPELTTLSGVIATALAPVVIVATWLLARRLAPRLTTGATTSAGVFLLACLLGLSLSNPAALAYDILTKNQPQARKPPKDQFAPGGVAAAVWIRKHSENDDIIATNVHCRNPDDKHCDNRNFWISAYAERRVVVEGWGYTSGTNEDSAGDNRNRRTGIPDKERLRINDAAFERPKPATVRRLVETYDVSFLLVSKLYDVKLDRLKALHQMVKKKYSNDTYVVFKVRDKQR